MKPVGWVALFFCLLGSPVLADAPDQCTNPDDQTPKYKPGSCHELVDGSPGCAGRCALGPMRITPTTSEACEGQPVLLALGIEGDKLTTYGDSNEDSEGMINWGDKKEEDLKPCCTWQKTHTYERASTYLVSATYGERYKGEQPPEGRCAYWCRQQQAVQVRVHPKTAPECHTGKYVQ